MIQVFCPPKATQGIALITVLWVTALMAVVVGSLSASVRSETSIASNMLRLSQAKNAAIGGIYLASYHLMQLQPDLRWKANGSVSERKIGDSIVRMSIVDEAGKVDLNFVQLDLLRKLLIAAQVEEDKVDMIADAILDWRDTDNFTRLNGAEDNEYELAGYPYGSKDGLFESIDELKLVLGVDQPLFDRLKDSVTVYSKRSDVNPALAPRTVMLAITNNDVETVDTYMALREANSQAGIQAPQAPMMAKPYITVAGGKAYTIYAEASAGSGVYSSVSSILATHRNIPEKPLEILVWRESGIALFERKTMINNIEKRI